MDKKTGALYFELFTEIGIINQLSRARADRRIPDDLTLAHFIVLNHLSRVGDGQTPLDMARAFQQPKTTLTHTLAGLEQRKLIEMRPNPKDGRSKCVWLTKKGSAFRESAIAGLAPGMESLSEVISPTEVERLIPQLKAIREYLDTHRDDIDDDQ